MPQMYYKFLDAFIYGRFIESAPQDLRINRSWESLPPHLALPMILMRESMKKSMIYSLSEGTLDLSTSTKSPKAQRVTNECQGFACPVCGRVYKLKSSLRNHQKWECGKDPQFKCPYCVYKAKQKMHMARHMERMHKEIDYSAVKTKMNIKREGNQELLLEEAEGCATRSEGQ